MDGPTDSSTPAAPPATPPKRTTRLRWLARAVRWSFPAAAVGVVGAVGLHELQHSRLQAWLLSGYTSELAHVVEPGPSPAIRFPGDGPYDERLGYHRLPDWTRKLATQGYAVSAQARMSETQLGLVDSGLFTIYPEKDQAGLDVADCSGDPLFSSRYPRRVYDRWEDIPPLLVDALLFIENRELLDPERPRMNPAIEWVRLGKAVGEQALRLIGDDSRAPGGSTLATQIEKYRHSPDGRTDGATEKLRQMVSASLRAYNGGELTMPRRREIVRSYLNTVPLAARPGWGEVHGIGDGLWAWYGQDFDELNDLLRSPPADPPTDAAAPPAPDVLDAAERRAAAFKQALSLMVAQRRPSHYLGANQDRALAELTDSYLRVMADAGVIPATLRDRALAIPLRRSASAPREAQPPFSERKAATALRTRLQAMLAVPRAYDLDRIDLRADSTLDAELQQAVTRTLRSLRSPEAARAAGLYGFRLLQDGDDPQHLQFSFTLYERGEHANLLRVQTDNVDQPFDINDGARLDLGSTAKLRTLVSYLEVIADLHARWSELDRAALQALDLAPNDLLSRWTREQLLAAPKASPLTLDQLLDAAMRRRYSASPHEVFYTGGGQHTFANFDPLDDVRTMDLRDALRRSVNLVFVRLIRDVVRHHAHQGPAAPLLRDVDSPEADALRRTYLERFIEHEGREFQSRFHSRYRNLEAEAIEDRLVDQLRGTPGPERLAAVFGALQPEGDAAALGAFIARQHQRSAEQSGVKLPLPTPEQVARLLQRHGGASVQTLETRARLSGLNPIELWTAAELRRDKRQRLADLVASGTEARRMAGAWLLLPGKRGAQDVRIRQMIEDESFEELHRRWQRLGYPFDALTPSYATALGASGDRPSALAELMGILVNGGERRPASRLDHLAFAVGTPYETHLQRQSESPRRVLPEALAKVVRTALIDVVDNGTAARLRGSLKDGDGKVIPIGGKTGTGDHRYEVYGRNGQLTSAKVVSRSGTFMFLIGERYFGTMMVYAAAPHAEGYTFTSALPTQALKTLMPALQPMLQRGLCQAPRKAGPDLVPSPADGGGVGGPGGPGGQGRPRHAVQPRLDHGFHEAVLQGSLAEPYQLQAWPMTPTAQAATVAAEASSAQ
ncbi:transglycosylase domain-containing protein [Sphaerotilus mobilis]|uniref:peptidoglycan glycosyltransferase n=1 Tax=Sphaerotilus mobilis TaxID=47994 RepID=A0A4Q7LF39_9BURK|nr:transglycosylase domain-containing protein [Sphaerotilus mobilis]RZS53125.1 membrane peptidoglycan carboxypeptidase [Sphaerotilus mobilis]